MNEIFEGIKSRFFFYKKEFILGGIIFLTATLSFGFGYLANRSFNHAPIIIQKCSASTGASDLTDMPKK